MGKTQTATLVPDRANQRLNGHHTKRLWKVRAVSGGRLFIGYFKHLPSCQLASEIICAGVGRAIGLNIPEFYLAKPLPEMGEQPGLPAVGFLSAQKRFHVFATWGNGNQDRMQAATVWSGYHLTAAFDEWIANTDRRLHNMLYDPTDRDFWLIDHAHAFGGPSWEPESLSDAGRRWENLLLEFERQTKGADDIHKWRTAANNLTSAAARLALDEMAKECNPIGNLQPRIDVACQFLQARLFRLRPLIDERLSGQQQLTV